MTDSEGKKGPNGAREQYCVFFLCLVTGGMAIREGYADGDLDRALRDARTLHGVVVRTSDGANTLDGTTWKWGRTGEASA